MKVRISNAKVEFFEGDVSIATYGKDYFSNLWPLKQLESESKELQSKYKILIKEDRPVEYFEKYIIDVIEKCLEQGMDKLLNDNKRLKAFLTYHIKTLRSLRKQIKISTEHAIDYIDNELYQLSVISDADLYKILNHIIDSEKK